MTIRNDRHDSFAGIRAKIESKLSRLCCKQKVTERPTACAFSRPTILRTSKIKPFPHFEIQLQLIEKFEPILGVDCTIKRTRNVESEKCGTRTWQ